MNEIQNLNPKCIWRNFYALTQVPRPSGHLEKIQQFLTLRKSNSSCLISVSRLVWKYLKTLPEIL